MTVILMMTSCSKPLSKSLSQEQLQEYINTLPEYPKRNTFSKKEQKRIASTPVRFKTWAEQMLIFYKCLKNNNCHEKTDS